MGLCTFLNPMERAQLPAMLRKQYLLHARNKKETFRETISVVFLMIVLIVLSNVENSVKYGSSEIYENVQISLNDVSELSRGRSILMAPCVSGGDEKYDYIASNLSQLINVSVVCHECEDSSCSSQSLMQTYFDNWRNVYAAVVFDHISPDISYRVRYPPDEYIDGFVEDVYQNPYKIDGIFRAPNNDSSAYATRLVPLQLSLDRAIGIVLNLKANSSWPTVSLQRFDSPSYYEQSYLSEMMMNIGPALTAVMFSMLVRQLVLRILEEKEHLYRIQYKTSGLTDRVFWLSHFIFLLMKNGLIVMVLALALKFAGPLSHSNFGVIWFFLMLFNLCSIAYSFAMSAFFQRSKAGGVVSMLIYLLMCAPGYGLSTDGIPQALRIVISFIAPSGFVFGLRLLYIREYTVQGVDFYSALEASHYGTPFASIVGIMAANVLIYTLAAVYINAVKQGEFGVARHPLFCIGGRFSKREKVHLEDASGKCVSESTDSLLADPRIVLSSGSIEQVRNTFSMTNPMKKQESVVDSVSSASKKDRENSQTSLDPFDVLLSGSLYVEHSSLLLPRSNDSLVCQNLTKTFPIIVKSPSKKSVDNNFTPSHPSHLLAVDNVSLVFEPGEITCILGHNGAGKSTLISMLTGLLASDRGTISSGGVSLRDDPAAFHARVGICRQSDVLLPELSALEHVLLFGAIKGMPYSSEENCARARGLLQELGLGALMHARPASLSGGERRRLSVANALVGDPKIVFLDEPSSSLDPRARRLLWRVLEREKRNRVIVLTTHFLDEADALGDRVVLMSGGRTRVIGSPLFLKHKFGSGFTFSLRGGNIPSVPAVEEICTQLGIKMQLLQPANEPRNEMRILLPRSARRALVSLCTSLDSLGGIDASSLLQAPDNSAGTAARFGYSVTCSTLEDVYLRLAEVLEGGLKGTNSSPSDAATGESLRESLTLETVGSVLEDPWVLDVRRRIWGSSEAAVRVGSSRVAEGIASPSLEQLVTAKLNFNELDSNADRSPGFRRWKVAYSQLCAQLRRRRLQLLRDRTQIWLQVVLPVVFVSFSLLFRFVLSAGTTGSLRGVDSVVPLDSASVVHEIRSLTKTSAAPALLLLPDLFDTTSPLWAAVNSSEKTAMSLGLSQFTYSRGSPSNASLDEVFSLEQRLQILASPNTPEQWGCNAGTELWTPSVLPSSDIHIGRACRGADWPSSVTSSSLQLLGSLSVRFADADSGITDVDNGDTLTEVLLRYNSSYPAALPSLISLISSAHLSLALPPGASSSVTPLNSTHFGVSTDSYSFSTGIVRIKSALHALPHPWPASRSTLLPRVHTAAHIGAHLTAFFVAIGLCTLPATAAAFYARERLERTARLQRLTGASPKSYWVAAWAWDSLQFLLTWAAVCTVLLLAGPSSLRLEMLSPGVSMHNASVTALLVLLAGVGLAPLAHCCSFLFPDPPSAQALTRLTLTALTALPAVGAAAADYAHFYLHWHVHLHRDMISRAARALEWIFCLIPTFSLQRGLAKMMINAREGDPFTDWHASVALYNGDGYSSSSPDKIVLPGPFEPTHVNRGGVHDLHEDSEAFTYDAVRSAAHWDIAGRELFLLALLPPFWFFLALWLQKRADRGTVTSPIKKKKKEGVNEEQVLKEPDAAAIEQTEVVEDKRAIDAELTGSQKGRVSTEVPLIAAHMRHGYAVPSSRTFALSDVSMRADVHEITGLLGQNGAGKSTLLSILTGEVEQMLSCSKDNLSGSRDSSKAYIYGLPVKAGSQYEGLVGYCPQSDALIPFLTCTEFLAFLARLSGFPHSQAERIAENALECVGLSARAHALTQTLSGGNKRRLSLAAAFVHSPMLLFLDEISTGVDAFARARIFQLLSRARENRAIVLTTHVMEEANALCSRIYIMNKGFVGGIGTPAFLKNKYGGGWTVSMRLHAAKHLSPLRSLPEVNANDGSADPLPVCGKNDCESMANFVVSVEEDWLSSAFPHHHVAAVSPFNLKVEVTRLTLAETFNALEPLVEKGIIADYSVSETTLEDAFLRLSTVG